MESEFAKKVGRETFEKLSQETQAVILQCFDHQRWLETEQAKLEYIYSLAQLHPVYSKQQNGLAEQAEQKIQRAFQTLVLEGGAPAPAMGSNGNGHSSTSTVNPPAQTTNGESNGKELNGQGSNGNGSSDDAEEFSFSDDLELSLEGL